MIQEKYFNHDFLMKNKVNSNTLAKFTFPYYALSRGLTVSWLNIEHIPQYKHYFKVEGLGGFYTIEGNGKKYSFNFSKIINSTQDNNVVKKDKLFILLDYLGIRYPKHEIIEKEKNEFSSKLKFPLVVKPILGSMGENVYANITTEAELKEAVSLQTTKAIIEEYIEGDEYRVYLLNGEPIIYCKRTAPFITGDGVSNIKALVKMFNRIKQKKRFAPVKIDGELSFLLAKKGYSLETVLQENEILILSNKKGRSSGALIENVSFISYPISETLKVLGKALSSFCFIGVDCIVKNKELYVLEVNLRPQISSAMFPDSGIPIDIPKLVIDSLFGAYYGEYFYPDDFTSQLRTLRNLSELDWHRLEYSCASDRSMRLILNT